MTHVDDFIDDPSGNKYARWMLNHFRLSAALRYDFDPFMSGRKLFCTHGDERYRVTGASRLGDVWLVADHSRDHGYDLRVAVDDCSDWSAEP